MDLKQNAAELLSYPDLQKFLRDYRDQIDTGNIVEVYKTAIPLLHKNTWTRFMDLLLLAKINPLEGATEIPKGFFGASDLERGVIPEGIISIGKNAFSLTEVRTLIVPSSLEKLEERAFGGMYRLEQVDLSQSKIKLIPNFCFSGDEELTFIKLPKTLTEIGYEAFEKCIRLKKIFYPGTIAEWKQIDKNTFIETYEAKVQCSDGICEVK